MLRLDIIDFIENFNSQLMQLTRFKILEFKGLFPLLCSARFCCQPGEISLFVSCFFFCTHEQLTISLKYSRKRTYSCHLTPLYINFLDVFWLMFWKCVKLWDKRQCMSLVSPRWKVVYFLASHSFGWWRGIISFSTSTTVLDQQALWDYIRLWILPCGGK